MSRKTKLTDEQRVKAVQEYLAGNGSYGHISRKYGIAYQSLTEMVLRARTEGIDSIKSGRNRKYSAETRNNAVLDYISGKGSQAEICSKYRIKSKSILRGWISWYNKRKRLLYVYVRAHTFAFGSLRAVMDNYTINPVGFMV